MLGKPDFCKDLMEGPLVISLKEKNIHSSLTPVVTVELLGSASSRDTPSMSSIFLGSTYPQCEAASYNRWARVCKGTINVKTL